MLLASAVAVLHYRCLVTLKQIAINILHISLLVTVWLIFNSCSMLHIQVLRKSMAHAWPILKVHNFPGQVAYCCVEGMLVVNHLIVH